MPEVRVEDEDGTPVVVLAGEHDVSTAAVVRSALVDAQGRGKGAVVELSLTSFIDSTILGIILGGLRRAREAGRGYGIVVAEREDQMARLLEVGGLLALFPTYRRRSEAVAAVREGINAPQPRPGGAFAHSAEGKAGGMDDEHREPQDARDDEPETPQGEDPTLFDPKNPLRPEDDEGDDEGGWLPPVP